MRLYLDTNMLIILWNKPPYPEISNDVREELFDYSNTLYTSSVCVHEFIHLLQIGKFGTSQKKIATSNIVGWLEEFGIHIAKINERHLKQLEQMPIIADHRDPNDRLIIAQAIVDKATLISSDRKFVHYEEIGLDFLFNDR